MMKRIKKLTYCILLFTICTSISCRKQHSSPLNNLRFSKITETNAGILVSGYRIAYTSQGNVDSIISTDSASIGYLKFQYFNNYYLIKHSTGYIDSVVTYNGNIIYIGQQSTGDTLYFIYDASNRLSQQIIHTYNAGTINSIDTTKYQWGSFDIYSIQSFTSPVPAYYTFNPNITGQTGDALRINQFLSCGRTYLNSPHLPIQETYYGNPIANYSYSYDADGRITKLTIAENYSSGSYLDTVVYLYQYSN